MATVRTVSGPVNVVSARSPLSRLVVPPVVGISGAASLIEAAQMMELANVSALLVDDRAGIVTERDLARALGAGRSPEDTVSTVATPHPLVVDGAMSVLDAAALMLNEQVRHLVVVLPEEQRGVVSIRDLLAVLLEAADDHVWLASLRVAIEAPAEIWLG